MPRGARKPRAAAVYYIIMIVWTYIRPVLTLDTVKTIAASIVGSRLDYCNGVLYGVSQSNIHRLQRVQNVLVRVG